MPYKNPEAAKVAQRRNYLLHREDRIAYARKRREENPEYGRERSRKYRINNKEKCRRINREWYLKNTAYVHTRTKKWQVDNHEQHLGHSREQYKRRSRTGGERAKGFVARLVKAGKLKRLSEEVVGCVDCGARASCYDHRDYNKPDDVEPVCRKCNYARGPATSWAEKESVL